jgi:hypothetical protein
MKLKINPIGQEPISLDDAKSYLQVDYFEDDKLISRLIHSARQYVETFCGISIIEKEIELIVTINSTPFLLPYGPIKEITLLEVDGQPVTNIVDEYVYDTGTMLEAKYTTGQYHLPEGLEQLIYDILKIYYDARGTAVKIPAMTSHALSIYSRNLFI